MFERYTDRARRVIVLTQEEARLHGHPEITPAHILLGLIDEGEGVAARVLDGVIDQDDVVKQFPQLHSTMPPVGHIPFSNDASSVLERAFREALKLGHNYIGTEHLLLGWISSQHDHTLIGDLGPELADATLTMMEH